MITMGFIYMMYGALNNVGILGWWLLKLIFACKSVHLHIEVQLSCTKKQIFLNLKNAGLTILFGLNFSVCWLLAFQVWINKVFGK